jgi:hypothetical protein
MIELSSVPAWLIDGGIGHALASDRGESNSLRYVTACGIATNRGRVIETLPHSICGRCRRVLASDRITLKPRGATSA